MKRGIEKKVTEMSRLIAQPVTEVHLAPAPLASAINLPCLERYQRHAGAQKPATGQ
jgi:hypothetical protein